MGFFTNINSLADVPTFDVVKEKLYDAGGSLIKGAYSLQRSDTQEHFGMCSDMYRPIQMDEMFDVIDEATNRLGGIQHTGFALSGNGKRIVVRSEIDTPDVLELSGDPVSGLIYTVIDNTGKSSNKALPSTMRISCTNALHLVDASGNGATIRHSNTYNHNVDIFMANLQSNIETIVTFGDVASSLRDTKFTKEQMVKFIEILLPQKVVEGNLRPVSSRLRDKRLKIVDLYDNGMATEGHSRWDALNAVTQFETHQEYTTDKFLRSMTNRSLSSKALKILNVA